MIIYVHILIHTYLFHIFIECKAQFQMIKGAYLDEGNEIDITVAEAIKVLWNDPGMYSYL
jgi:hypothetical protein